MKRVITRLLATLLLTTVFAACSQETFEDLSATQLLDLGERFLLEGNYEQAMIHFARLIEIEPMNPRGHVGLARAYFGMGNPARAREVLEQGPEDTEIRDMLEEMDATEREAQRAQQREALGAEVADMLEELAELDEEALLEKLETGDLESIIEELDQILDFPLIFDGIGIHRFGNMVYIGEFVDGRREGFGRWFTLRGTFFSEGQWSADAPNGQFSVRQYNQITGNVVNGLWHGPVAYVFPPPGMNYTPRFDMGRVVVIEANDLPLDGHPVYRFDELGWKVFSDEQVNALWGIPGFAEMS